MKWDWMFKMYEGLTNSKKQGPHEILRRASTDVPLLTRVGFLSGLGTGKDGRVVSIQ